MLNRTKLSVKFAEKLGVACGKAGLRLQLDASDGFEMISASVGNAFFDVRLSDDGEFQLIGGDLEPKFMDVNELVAAMIRSASTFTPTEDRELSNNPAPLA